MRFDCDTIYYQKDVPMEDYLKDCVDVPKFLGYCRKCTNFGKIWSCPEFDFDPMDIWRNYQNIRVIAMKILVPEKMREKEYDAQGKTQVITTILNDYKKEFDRYILEEESKLEGAVGLSGGSCLLCQPAACSRQEGKPCRHPDQMRHSIESLGGNVSLTVSKYLDQKLEWIEGGRLPAHFMLVGGILW
ncbi:MAG: metal-binding protein [Eubacterium sp.]|nr:metal-binding protein [Eubacterium sp.]